MQTTQMINQSAIDGSFAVQHGAHIHDQLSGVHHQLAELLRIYAGIIHHEAHDTLLHLVEVGKSLGHTQHQTVHADRVDGHSR